MNILMPSSISNLGTCQQWKELKGTILSRPVHKWDVWEIARNFIGWCHKQIFSPKRNCRSQEKNFNKITQEHI